MPENGTIFDIQRFSVHDGPGIRTGVFLKGCSCRCSWCHNPESVITQAQIEFYPSRCIGCGRCFTACVSGAHGEDNGTHIIDRKKCSGCGQCADTCYSGALVLKGKKVTTDEVMETILEDKEYYTESGGGITLSGGEPVLQSAFACEVLSSCKQNGIHTALQTAGNYPFGLLEPLLGKLDMIMYDIKGFSQNVYAWHIKGDRERIFENLRLLDGTFDGTLVVRTPVVGPVNDSPDEISKIAQFLAELRNIKYYQLIPYHSLGKVKYDALDETFAEEYYTPSAQSIFALEETAARHIPVFNNEKGMLYRR